MSLPRLDSFVSGSWQQGNGRSVTLVDPTTEASLAEATSEGVSMSSAYAYARDVGGPALRALGFRERGELLRGFSRALHAHRDELMALGVKNAGNTRSDAKFDVDGASATLASYADLGAELGDAKMLVDGEPMNIGRSSKLSGQHLWTTRLGVALHINAFNFPAWGLAEKAAVALLAGMPVISKPATSTALMAHRIMQIVVEEKLLPPGALSFIAGSTGDLVDQLREQDVLAFTGSGGTGAQLRGMKNVIACSVRVNVEADSLNAAILGGDVEAGSETFELFVKDVVRDITQKAGQKCTAIRRVFVPRARLEEVRALLLERLADTKVGDPSRDEVTMGPVATKRQQTDVLAGIERLKTAGARVLVGGGVPEAPIGVEAGKGYFVAPTLLECASLESVADVHDHEVFGPSTTLLPYDGDNDVTKMIELVRRGGGGLVASVYADDKAFLREVFLGIASSHGRVVLGNEKVAGGAVPPGTVMPGLVHGGPGRAGGGEELGGFRGLFLYMQRTALQGYGPFLASLASEGKRI